MFCVFLVRGSEGPEVYCFMLGWSANLAHSLINVLVLYTSCDIKLMCFAILLFVLVSKWEWVEWVYVVFIS